MFDAGRHWFAISTIFTLSFVSCNESVKKPSPEADGGTTSKTGSLQVLKLVTAESVGSSVKLSFRQGSAALGLTDNATLSKTVPLVSLGSDSVVLDGELFPGSQEFIVTVARRDGKVEEVAFGAEESPRGVPRVVAGAKAQEMLLQAAVGAGLSSESASRSSPADLYAGLSARFGTASSARNSGCASCEVSAGQTYTDAQCSGWFDGKPAGTPNCTYYNCRAQADGCHCKVRCRGDDPGSCRGVPSVNGGENFPCFSTSSGAQRCCESPTFCESRPPPEYGACVSAGSCSAGFQSCRVGGYAWCCPQETHSCGDFNGPRAKCVPRCTNGQVIGPGGTCVCPANQQLINGICDCPEETTKDPLTGQCVAVTPPTAPPTSGESCPNESENTYGCTTRSNLESCDACCRVECVLIRERCLRRIQENPDCHELSCPTTGDCIEHCNRMDCSMHSKNINSGDEKIGSGEGDSASGISQ